MSIKLMASAWDLDIPSTEKMVLLCLCDYAGDEGHCWPSVPTIARKCSKSHRTVQAAIQWLRNEGFCSWDETPGKPHRFTLNPRKINAESRAGLQHYVYRIDDADTGYFYIGARSCQGAVEDDDYMGSGNWVVAARKAGHALRKTILEVVGSRSELAQAELRHAKPVFGTADCKNEKLPTPGTLSATPAESAPHTPASSAPRNSRTPQLSHPTPANLAPKPLRTTNSSSEPNGSSPRAWALPAGVSLQVWEDFLTNRKRKRQPNTPTAWKGFLDDLARVSAQTGIPPPLLIEQCTAKGWGGIYDPNKDQGHERTDRMGRHQPDGLSETTRAARSVFGAPAG